MGTKVELKIKSGTRSSIVDHRDYDLHRTFGAAIPPQFPAEYLCDSGLTMPDQNADGQPTGCTNYTQADLSTDLDLIIKKPSDLEAITHANALGGYDIRQSLIAATKLGWFSMFFNIKAYAPLDYFDAFRLAQVSGGGEKRSITLGTPWFPSWEQAALSGHSLMPMPSESELEAIRDNPNALSWHNSKLDGWTTIQGVLVYRDKSWQGTHVGDKGFLYFPREVINTVMAIKGTVAFTGTKMNSDTPVRIDTSILQWILSHIYILLKFKY